ncbi:MAG: two-component system response regulator [Deltaproteobacteria bacterium]|jgi:putative two-component system response regulator|nr:two-component system response regulator [Deltaproteobacteria bacterium]
MTATVPETKIDGYHSEVKMPRVMVVDDEKLNLKLIAAMLKPQGYEVILANNGEECLSKVHETPPDLILLDIMMPGMNGFEVVNRLKQDEKFAMVPIVMVTALQDVNDRVKALEVGADDFLSKPVDRMELRARVRSLLKVKAYNDHMINYRHELESEVRRRTLEIQETNKMLAKAHEKLRGASLETIFRLSRAAEFKDEDTGAHIISMSRISARIADRMGLSSTTVESILYASPMHDIGKIGIPDRILLKNGPLTEEEWAVMRLHTVYGGKILENSDIGFLRLGEVIAVTHHEKFDGSGYPRGLKGHKIPLAGRIVAVADVFDALMSRRPYKPAFSADQAISIITDGRAQHFDPDVVDVFLADLPELQRIWNASQAEHQSEISISLKSQSAVKPE